MTVNFDFCVFGLNVVCFNYSYSLFYMIIITTRRPVFENDMVQYRVVFNTNSSLSRVQFRVRVRARVEFKPDSSSSSSRVRACLEFELELSSSFAFSSSMRASFFKLASFRARVEFGFEFSSSSRA